MGRSGSCRRNELRHGVGQLEDRRRILAARVSGPAFRHVRVLHEQLGRRWLVQRVVQPISEPRRSVLGSCAAPLRHAPAKRGVHLVVPDHQPLKNVCGCDHLFQHGRVVARRRTGVARRRRSGVARSAVARSAVVCGARSAACGGAIGEKLEVGENLIHFRFHKREFDVKCVTCHGCGRVDHGNATHGKATTQTVESAVFLRSDRDLFCAQLHGGKIGGNMHLQTT